MSTRYTEKSFQKYKSLPTTGSLVRAKDFAETGNYLATVGGKTFRIYRESIGTTGPISRGDWVVDRRHLPKDFHAALLLEVLGQSKDEAMEQLAEVASKLKNPVRR